MSDFDNAFNPEFKPARDYDLKLTGPIAGRIKRGPGVGKAEARRRAAKYSWYSPELVYDGRCKRWHVFRATR